jgi:hypothetical protein
VKTTLRILAVLLVGFESVWSQYEASVSGYVMEIPAYQGARWPIAEQFLNLARLRVRPRVALWSNAGLTLEYELSSLYHSTPAPVGAAQEESNRQIVPLRWSVIDESRHNLIHYIDRLHFDQTFGDWDLVVGRQRIAWGTGRVWNPTDLFNPLNPTNYGKIEKDGVDAAVVRFHPGSFTGISVVLNPQHDWETMNAGLRYRTNFSEFDVSVMGGVFDDRVVLGGDFAGNFLNAGVRGEGIVSAASDQLDSGFTKLILGIDYQFTSKLYGLLEYHFNGEGTTVVDRYDITRLAKGLIVNVGKNYWTAQVSYLVHPLVNTLFSYTRNLDDKSLFLGIGISYSAADEAGVTIGGQLFSGETMSEYGRYPNSLYVKAEFFF